MKEAFSKLMQGELDNIVYLIFAIILVAVIAWCPDMSDQAKTLVSGLYGVLIVKVKGGSSQ